MKHISIQEARTLAIGSQLLDGPSLLNGKEGTRQVIEHLGYVQIDTISVVARAHHHALWSRVPDYSPAHLQSLEEEDRAVFEYWAHAASYLPMADYRFSLPRKEEFISGDGHWFKKDHKMIARVYERIKQEGPLMSKDFENPSKNQSKSNGMDWARNPVNLALRQLFMEGRIMVAGRRGFQKAYDLPERILPPHVDTRMPSRKEYFQYIVERDVRAHGLVKATEIAYLLKNTRKEVDALLKEMVHEGILAKVKVEGINGEPYFIGPQSLDKLHAEKVERRLRILSPFDNLVIQRKRLEELFGFKYTLECYVPAAKRKFGYFGLPLLLGDEFIGQIDLKADRKTKTLWINNLELKENSAAEHLPESLREFAAFNHCERIETGKEAKRKLKKSLNLNY